MQTIVLSNNFPKVKEKNLCVLKWKDYDWSLESNNIVLDLEIAQEDIDQSMAPVDLKIFQRYVDEGHTIIFLIPKAEIKRPSFQYFSKDQFGCELEPFNEQKYYLLGDEYGINKLKSYVSVKTLIFADFKFQTSNKDVIQYFKSGVVLSRYLTFADLKQLSYADYYVSCLNKDIVCLCCRYSRSRFFYFPSPQNYTKETGCLLGNFNIKSKEASIYITLHERNPDNVIVNYNGNDIKVQLNKQAFQVLLTLAKSSEIAVSYDEIFKRCWPDDQKLEAADVLGRIRKQKSILSKKLAATVDKSLLNLIENVPTEKYRLNLPESNITIIE